MFGIRKDTGEYEKNADSCQLCKKMIINAGISEVIIKTDDDLGYKIINVQDWIENDELLERKDNLLERSKNNQHIALLDCGQTSFNDQ